MKQGTQGKLILWGSVPSGLVPLFSNALAKPGLFAGNDVSGAHRVTGVGVEAAKGRIFLWSLVLMFLKLEKGETKVRLSFSSLSLLSLQKLIPNLIP